MASNSLIAPARLPFFDPLRLKAAKEKLVLSGLPINSDNLQTADLIQIADFCDIDESEVIDAINFDLNSAMDTASTISTDSSSIGKRAHLNNSEIFSSDDESDSRAQNKKFCKAPTKEVRRQIISEFLSSFGFKSVAEFKALKNQIPSSQTDVSQTNDARFIEMNKKIANLSSKISSLEGQIEQKNRKIASLQMQQNSAQSTSHVSLLSTPASSLDDSSLLSDDTPLTARNIKAFIAQALTAQVIPLFKELVIQVKNPQKNPPKTPQTLQTKHQQSAARNARKAQSATSSVVPAAVSSTQPPLSQSTPPSLESRPLISYADLFNSSTPSSDNAVSITPGNDGFTMVSRRRVNKTPDSSSNPTSSPLQVVSPKPPSPAHTVLVIPDSVGTNVMDILKSQKLVKPSDLGIKNIVRFPSGPSLFTCSSEEHSKKLKDLVASTSGIQVKAPVSRDPTFRIHNIPKEISLEDVQKDIQFKFGKPATEIIFVSYQKPVVAETKLAVCKVDYDMFEKASSLKRIRIGWDSLPITTIPHVSRCDKCLLLGHRSKHCNSEISFKDKMIENSCIDCHVYNDRLTKAKIANSRHRPTNHTSGVTDCPTYQCFLRKASNFSTSQSSSAGGAGTMEQ